MSAELLEGERGAGLGESVTAREALREQCRGAAHDRRLDREFFLADQHPAGAEQGRRWWSWPEGRTGPSCPCLIQVGHRTEISGGMTKAWPTIASPMQAGAVCIRSVRWLYRRVTPAACSTIVRRPHKASADVG